MSHGKLCNIDVEEMLESRPINVSKELKAFFWGCIAAGVLTFFLGLGISDTKHLWGAYYTNVIFWMGLAAGGTIPAVIFQIVRAEWSPPIRRISEANVAFLPWALLLFVGSYFGKDHLFYWATKPMPGREWWMQPNFAYLRAVLLLAFLFYLLTRYVRISLRGDIGVLREKAPDKERWKGWLYMTLAKDWKGEKQEVSELQRSLSCSAPVVIIFYAIIYTLFATEMVVGMDPIWFSNMYGGFTFVGNIYIGWASIAIIAMLLAKHTPDYARVISTQQLWDLGKLTFGFCMLWGYMFFAQFLPQWYGNMPEETQWMILRTREYPWKLAGYVAFSMCFVLPFIMLLSRDLKKTPKAYGIVAVIILLGVWCEKYVTVLPQLFPHTIPFGWLEVGLFIGFFGAYGLSLQAFLRRFPYVPLSHPLTRGETEW